mgnify:CR=1 FL=1
MRINHKPPRYADGIEKHTTQSFGGYNHTKGAVNGEIYDMRNMCSDAFPFICTRPERIQVGTGGDALYGMCAAGIPGETKVPYWIERVPGEGDAVDPWLASVGGAICPINAPLTSEVPAEAAPKRWLVPMNDDIIVFPEGYRYNVTNNAGAAMASVVQVSCLRLGEEKKGYNGTVKSCCDVQLEGFVVGDVVYITGAETVGVDPDHPYTVRDVINDIGVITLAFDNGVFDRVTQGGDYMEITADMTVERRIPALQYVFECNNRIWGVEGNTIYCSVLGNPTAFGRYDGLTTDSWAVDVGSGGAFTGGCAFLGYPHFFKEDKIYRIYGSDASTYQLEEISALGVEYGSDMSLAIAGETLFYKSRVGIMAWRGGFPVLISENFGVTDGWQGGVGGSDGRYYYISLLSSGETPERAMFVYDTSCNMWHREDNANPLAFDSSGAGFKMLCRNQLYDGTSKLLVLRNPRNVGSETPERFDSMVEFGEFDNRDIRRKGVSKLLLRLGLEKDAEVNVYIRYNRVRLDAGEWEHAGRCAWDGGRESYVLALKPKRTDSFAIRLEGQGQWTLYSVVREHYSGSDIF